MDKIILNEEQLAELKSYIQKRGIKEPDVIAEILDHFACKVEEIMSEYTYVNFETAVRRAHQSFGATGFRTLTKAYEDSLSKEIWTNYKQSLIRTISSPKIVLILAMGWASNFLYKILVQQLAYNNWLDPKDSLLVITIGILFLWRVSMYFSLKSSFGNMFSFSRKNRSQNLWQIKAGSVFSLSSISLLAGQFLVPRSFNINGMAIFCSILVVLELVCFSAHEQTIRTVVAKYEKKNPA